MIQLLNESRTYVIGYFQNYNDLADYIHQLESSRTRMLTAPCLDLTPLNWEREQWDFTVYAHGSLKTTYAAMRDPPLTGIELESFQNGLDLLEIHCGEPNNLLQIPVTKDVDIESLRKDWCLSYCKAHHYTVVETADGEPLETKDMDYEGMEQEYQRIIGGKHDLAL